MRHSLVVGEIMRRRVKISKLWLILVFVVAIVVGYVLIDNAARPTILSVSEARLRAIAVKAMNDAVRQTVGSDTSYTDLISIEKDSNGDIKLISANAAKMNNLAANTAITAQDKILNIGEQGISIPLGTIIGGQMMSGRGPSIKVKIEPVGSVTTDFMTEFEDAGINQTRHKIFLILNATVRIVLGNTSQTVEISSQVLISETIIVGNVPNSFAYYDEYDGDKFELIPDSKKE